MLFRSPLTVKGHLIATMHPDFTITPIRNGMAVEFHEVKGLATAKWRVERKLLAAQYPRLKYIVIDAGQPGGPNTGTEPRLFDDRPRRKRRKK